MAGSYKHIVKNDGNLASNQAVTDTLETGGDIYEAVEEMYGMIWYLASIAKTFGHPNDMKSLVEDARQNYVEGLTIAEEVNGA